MKSRLLVAAAAAAGLTALCSAAFAQKAASRTDWAVYGGQRAGDHYSALSEINRANVGKLRVAWTFDTGEKISGFESSPLIVGDVLYAPTPTGKVVALNAATGKQIWSFSPGIQCTQPIRGLTYWNGRGGPRLFAGIMNYLYAIDPKSGKAIATFGEDGRVDLRKGLGRDYRTQSIALTTPGIIYKDLIIVGGRVPETHPAPPGDIRAYDVLTGSLRWDFHTIPRPGEYGYNTWPKNAWKTAGSANNWAGMALDARRGIVYVPTGSAVFDLYGGDRIGNDLFADSLIALNAETGKRIWSFQDVHHDIWDRDLPSPPALLTVERNGRRIDAIAQTTKQGYLYLFNRVNGHPLFPIVERRVPASTVPGEVASPTQPMPLLPAPYVRQKLTAQQLTDRTPAAHAYALKKFKTLLGGSGPFVPLSLNRQTIVFPGFDGGAEWGGPAVDPNTAVIYINANEMAWTGGLVRTSASGGAGAKIYAQSCAVCHGADRHGAPPVFPSLIGISNRISDRQIEQTVAHGKGRMPPFPSLATSSIKMHQLLRFLKSDADLNHHGGPHEAGAPSHEPSNGTPATSSRDEGAFQFTGYRQFLDQDGYPAIKPPWGTLNAIDLNTGKYLWKIPLGNYPKLTSEGLNGTGSENYGGPIVTAGGLVFIGATIFDHKIRAFDSRTGRMLWQAELPGAGTATPATYMVNGRQYVVIAAAASKFDPPSDAKYVAFALP